MPYLRNPGKTKGRKYQKRITKAQQAMEKLKYRTPIFICTTCNRIANLVNDDVDLEGIVKEKGVVIPNYDEREKRRIAFGHHCRKGHKWTLIGHKPIE